MSTNKQARIVIDAIGIGYVELDGQRLKGARSLRFHAEAGARSTLEIEFVGYDVEIDAPAEVLAQLRSVDVTTLGDSSRRFALG